MVVYEESFGEKLDASVKSMPYISFKTGNNVFAMFFFFCFCLLSLV